MSSLREEDGKVLTEYQYTAAGRLKEARTPEGFTASYEYDGDGNLSRLRIGNEEKGSFLYDAFLLYDLNGNRTGKRGKRLGADGNMRKMYTAYSYDRMNRLTEERRSADGDRYAYDLAGNRLKKQHYNYALENTIGTANAANSGIIDGEETYCYNERNELTERRNLSVITEYLYDENGSLVGEKEGERRTSYQYDLLNRQTHVGMPDGRKQENFYDGEGLRAGLKENREASTFLYLNGEILAECSGNHLEDSMPVKRHLSGLGLSHVQTLNDGVYHAYHQDEQGSTVYITGSDGAAENCYLYDTFGNVVDSQETIRNRIRYTGQQYDQETGQYYLRARFYNPMLGRFTQEDTYRGDGLNLYAYCGNNPVVYYDPSGHNMSDYEVQPAAEPEKTKSAGESGRKTDFYVTPSGDVVPAATGYRYMDLGRANDAIISGEQYTTYIRFKKYDSASQVKDAFQIADSWSDCRVRGEFDTLQVIDDLYVPTTKGNTTAIPEPITFSYPEYGNGGEHQLRVDKVVKFVNVDFIGD